jgi:hypothetical protein
VFVTALVHAFESPVEGFPTLVTEHGPFALKAVALLPPRETRAELRSIVFAGTTKSTWPLTAQSHPQGMMQQWRSEMMHAEGAMPAMFATRRTAGGEGERHEQKKSARIFSRHALNL